MKQLGLALLFLSLSVVALAQSGIIAVTSDGQQVLLNSDQTWEYVQLESDGPENSAVLEVTEVVEMDEACRLQVKLQNNLGYRISSLVPRLRVINQDNILYTATSLSFTAVKPTKAKYAFVQFSGIGCRDISEVLVFDASRCKMGEIDQFNEEPGQCLSRIYVQPSDLININRAS
ncbi:MAG: DUF3157 family protein [Halioglobus sp.]|nr:DUF3157 family protein [Halioglobus sp.]